jgi:signal transduction histidine kinase
MNAPTPAPAGDASANERHALIAELFHALSQPLTALRCSLELALHEHRPVEPSRADLRLALQHAEKIARLAGGIRELVEYGGDPTPGALVPLDKILQEGVADMLPVAESAGVRLSLGEIAAYSVRAEKQKLEQAIFYLLESAVAAAGAGGGLRVEARQQGEEIAVVFSAIRGTAGKTAGNEDEQLGRRLGMAIAGRYLEAVGGRLYAEQSGNELRLHLRLPGAQAVIAQP